MKKKTIQFDIITIFPDMVAPYFKDSILGKAIKKKLIKFKAHDLANGAKINISMLMTGPMGADPAWS